MILEKDPACGMLIYQFAYLLGIRNRWRTPQLIVVLVVLAMIFTHS